MIQPVPRLIIAVGAYPHRLILDLGSTQTVTGFKYVPRQGATVTGRIKNYKIYVGDGLVVK